MWVIEVVSDIQIFIDMIFKLGILAIGFAALAILHQHREKELSEERKRFVERINELKSQVDEYRQRINELNEKHRVELEHYTRINKMLEELKKAIDNNAIRLTCPSHQTYASILVDGTIICEKGHRIWPREDKEVEGHG